MIMNLQDLFQYLIAAITLRQAAAPGYSVGVPAKDATSYDSNRAMDGPSFKSQSVKEAGLAVTDKPSKMSYPASSSGKPMIDSINEYRKRAGLPAQIWDTTLVANAAKTGKSTDGKAMVHQMNRGTRGQVLVMGVDDEGKCTRNFANWTPFELYYYSWLCEVPGDPALGGECNKILKTSRIASGGQTGHHMILSNKGYKNIGCAFTRNSRAAKCAGWTGIWACDLG
jgi:uncharacterized protein YkwD